MKKGLMIGAVAAAAVVLVGATGLAMGNGFIPEVNASTGNSVIITTQATEGSGNIDLATSSAYHVQGSYTTMLALADSGYDFTAGAGANINFGIGGSVTGFTYSGKGHGNNMVLDVWAKEKSTDGETLCYRCNKADGASWYGGQEGVSAVSNQTDNCEHIATLVGKHFFRFNFWAAGGGTSMSIKNLTISWTC